MRADRGNILACFLPFIGLFLIPVSPALAQQAKVEHIGAVSTAAVSSEVAAAIDDKGYRVTLEDGWNAELWLVKELKLATNDAPNALIPG